MTLRSAIRHHPIQSAGFVLALAITVFFAGRLILNTIYWADPAHRDQGVEGWMTPGYIGHSWHVPREVIAQALELTPEDARPRLTLESLAERRGVTVDALGETLMQAIETFRKEAGT